MTETLLQDRKTINTTPCTLRILSIISCEEHKFYIEDVHNICIQIDNHFKGRIANGIKFKIRYRLCHLQFKQLKFSISHLMKCIRHARIIVQIST